MLSLHAQGMLDKEIARELGLSVRTVRAHMTIAVRRLHARTRAEAVVIALRAGLLPALDAPPAPRANAPAPDAA